jgi:uncharacterized coiled-coil DUF342 family protein
MFEGVKRMLNAMIGRTKRVRDIADQVDEIKKSRGQLRESISQLGQDVWGMVETGDPLRALVHGARSSQFRKKIDDEDKTDGKEATGK